MGQRLQDTDVVVMMEFERALRPLYDAKPWNGPAIKAAASPFLNRLRDNGHAHHDAVSLLGKVWATMGHDPRVNTTPNQG